MDQDSARGMKMERMKHLNHFSLQHYQALVILKPPTTVLSDFKNPVYVVLAKIKKPPVYSLGIDLASVG